MRTACVRTAQSVEVSALVASIATIIVKSEYPAGVQGAAVQWCSGSGVQGAGGRHSPFLDHAVPPAALPAHCSRHAGARLLAVHVSGALETLQCGRLVPREVPSMPGQSSAL